MKKILYTLALVVVLVMPATAATWVTRDFINGGGIWITNGVPVSFQGTGIIFTNTANMLVKSYTSNFYATTNMAYGGMVTNGWATNGNGTLFGYAWDDVPLLSDANGNLPTGPGISITVAPPTADTGTNQLNFAFVPMPDGQYPAFGHGVGATSQVFTCSVNIRGPITNTTVWFPLGSGQMAGMSKLRLQTITPAADTAANSPTNILIRAIRLIGWQP